MVSVTKRPTGHKLIDQAIDATIIESYEGDALVVFPYHSLSDGDTVYIDSDIDEYNGFKTVTVVTYQTFKISDSDFIPFYQEIEIEYYKTQSHDWSAVFLPIVYKLSNDRWPTNSVDTVRTVSSQADDNGFTLLNLSGALKTSFNALEFVDVTGYGVYQIVEVITTSQIVISLPYDSSNVFTTAQYYYNNFQVKIKIYAGLPADHPWEPHKPFEEVGELSLTPDENNEVMFSVSDYVKSKVKIENNTTLYSLPLNLDAFTGFYVSTAESFDQSDNYALYTSESTFADDTFTGYAAAGKLAFKNVYSGDYADYVYTSGSPALWLVNSSPLAVEGMYFDISFIKNVEGSFRVLIDKYFTNDYSVPQILDFEDMGIGVYRIPITPDAQFISYCIQVVTNSRSEEVIVPPTPFNLEDFQNDPSTDPAWTLGSEPFIVGQFTSRVLYISFPTTTGTPYKFNYRFVVDNVSPGSHPFYLSTYDALISGVSFQSVTVNANGVYEGSVNITPASNGLYFGVQFSNGSGNPMDVRIEMLSVGDSTTETVEVPGATITEEICIDIIDQCEVGEGIVQGNRRLLEDGGYRLLE